MVEERDGKGVRRTEKEWNGIMGEGKRWPIPLSRVFDLLKSHFIVFANL